MLLVWCPGSPAASWPPWFLGYASVAYAYAACALPSRSARPRLPLCCAALGWCGVLPAASSEPVFLLDQDYYDRHQSRPFAVVPASPRCVLSIHARAQLRSVRAEHHASLRLCEGIVVEASIVCSSVIEQK